VARDERHRAGCRITIDIAPGVYRGSIGGGSDPSFETLPLVIDVPDVTLHGALALVTDASGRPTGAGRGDAVTTLLPDPPLVSTSGPYSEPIFIVNGSVDGFGGDHATIEGLAFQSGHSGADFGGLGILSLRVAGLVIRGNRFEPGFLSALDLRATVGGTVKGNHLSGGGGSCDICLAGPGSFRVESNRLLAGGIPGILVLPTVLLPVPPDIEQYVLPAAAEVDAALVNNEIRDHLRVPVGAGIRVGAVGVGAPSVAGRARVRARGNVLINNRFAMIVEAAFPVAGTLLKGDIELSLHHNVFAASCQNDLLVTLSRHTTGLGLAGGPYLMNSAYTLALNGNLDWANAWYSHPAGLGNTLVVDGAEVPNGTFHAYDATKTCTP
jgi:hypothetical protein